MNGQSGIDEALSHGRPQDMVEGVKEAVARELERVSSSFEVRTTSYFNHSYVPDLVAWWGQGDDDKREVFLRFDGAQDSVAEDVQTLETSHPLFFSLTPHQREEVSDPVLNALETSPTVLLTDAVGMDALAGAAGQTFEELVSATVVKGGRGFVDEARALEVRSATAEGVAAAVGADRTETLRAILSMRDVLAEPSATRIEKYLQTLWLAGGGAISQYPGDQGGVLDIGSADVLRLVRFLFTQPEVARHDFWKRLGERLDTEALESLISVPYNANLQWLVQTNLTRFEVSQVIVDNKPPRLADVAEPFRWQVVGSLLELEGPGFDMRFTTDGRHFRGRAAEHSLLSISALASRVEGLRVERLTLDEGRIVHTLAAKDDESDAAPSLDEFASSVGADAKVRSVGVRLHGGKDATCFFDRRLTDVDTGMAALGEVGSVAAALLVAIDQEPAFQLAIFLSGLPNDPEDTPGTM
jgi:hypothetical protein